MVTSRELRNGKGLQTETQDLVFMVENIIFPIGFLRGAMDEDSDARYLLQILYDHAHGALCDLARALEQNLGKIEVLYAGNALQPTILDARLAPAKEVQA